ncbi:MAG TPA: NAD-dependent DNA ligase LigA [Alphaproteobacteria bacterium]|nr:NAD-dependent DNA ligase LigA [Alphaproteobacteria bacterium]
MASSTTRKQKYRRDPDLDFKKADRLSKWEARQEVAALRDGIDYHDRKYYVENAPVISDRVYDRLFKRLQHLEERFPGLQDANSPTRRIGGAPVEGLGKVRHTAPMRSLGAALEQSEVEDFLAFADREVGSGAPEFVAEPKFDGLSLEVVYEDGILARAATRGDGQTGDDVTHNARTIHSLPLRLSGKAKAPPFLALRGEAIMHKPDFQRVNKRRIERADEAFANPRNAAAGVMRRLDPDEASRARLDIVFYDVLQADEVSFDTQWDKLKRMRTWGLKTNPEARRVQGLKEVQGFRDRLGERREELDYEIDGIVLKLNDLEAQRRLGTRHRSPRWAMAWKYPPRQEVTTLQDIVVQVGMTGMLTPVALLEPVDVSGVTVSRASLHNEEEVRRREVWPGCRVRIQRAGDVIPQVVERIGDKGRRPKTRFSLPDNCPACGTRTVREGAYVMCPAGLSCPPQLVGRLIHYAQRRAMHIDGLGEQTARQLVDAGLVRDIADLHALDAGDLSKLEGFAEASARKLVRNIEAAREPSLGRFLFALGIRRVGERVAQDLAEHFGSLEAVRKAGDKEIDAVPGIGPEIRRSVRGFFEARANRRILDKLHRHGVSPRRVKRDSGRKPLKGKIFVFSGSLERRTRDEAQAKAEELGGRATSSVSSKTDYLVVGSGPGGKLDEAREHDVEVLDETQFERLIADA